MTPSVTPPHANLSPALSSYKWGFPAAAPLLSEGNSSTGSGLQQCPTRDQDDRDIRPNDQTWGRWHLGKVTSDCIATNPIFLTQVFVRSRLTAPFPLSVTHVSMFANNALLRGGVRVRACTREQIKDQKKIKGSTKPLMPNLDITCPLLRKVIYHGQFFSSHQSSC